ncbi:MAG: phosphinothricin acetyltransferase [Gemmatimonas sp.]|nr:phosphinothricin acetyltransferase [Gemmatimonas sp.]
MRDATAADAPGIAELYAHYVLNTTVTFEEDVVPAEEFVRRIGAVHDAALPWLVATQDGKVVGYAYATPWRPRSAYRFSVEVTVYVADSARGQGYGRALYSALFDRLRVRGLHAVLGGITLPNDASIALHEAMGMTKVAHLPEVGFKFGRWLDVGYWHRLL